MALTFDDVCQAAERIAPFAVHTPILTSPALDAVMGCRVYMKLENQQRIGAFKFRGAYNAMAQVDRVAFPGGVVACSSGNHAQGVAEAARILGMSALIIMPNDAPRVKVEGVLRAGGEIVAYDRETDDRNAMATAFATERKAAFIPPYDHVHVMAGQGTAALELVTDLAAQDVTLDALLVPASGGGLISGCATALEALSPQTQLISVEPEGFDDLARSLKQGSRVTNSRTGGSVCDALLSPTPGALTFPICAARLSHGVSVSDDAALAAMVFAFRTLKIVTEPGGSIALAALLSGAYAPDADRAIGLIISGGNVDPELLTDALGAHPVADLGAGVPFSNRANL